MAASGYKRIKNAQEMKKVVKNMDPSSVVRKSEMKKMMKKGGK